VEITFIEPDLCALCNSKAALARCWGPERGALVAQRLAELHALDRLADLKDLAHIDVTAGENGTVISAGGQLVIVVEATPGGATGDLETLKVLAIEDREEER
jgi:hypothetical protein